MVVNEPIGTVVTGIPPGYQTVVVNGVAYYSINVVTYRQVANGYASVAKLKAKGVVDNAQLASVLKGESALVIGRLSLIHKDAAWGLLGLGSIRDGSASGPATVQTSAANRSKHPTNPCH